jgi:VCBS repeat-containing protein
MICQDPADKVGLFQPGAPNASPLSRLYTNGTTAPGATGVSDGSVNLPIPADLVGGSYEARLISGRTGATLARLGVTVAARPVAVNDTYNLGTSTTLTVPAPGVLANDTDADSSSVQAAVVTTPFHGTLTMQSDGSFSYTTSSTFAGSDSFTYRAADSTGLTSALATVTLTGTVASGAPSPSPSPSASPSPSPSPTASASPSPSPSASPSPSPSPSGSPSPGASPSPAPSTTPGPTSACSPRPLVRPQTAAGSGKLLVHVESTPLNTQVVNPLRQIKFGEMPNARVTLNGQPVRSGDDVTLPAITTAVDFTVERVTPGQATTVHFVVVDDCGEWKTFVGGGAGAGF